MERLKGILETLLTDNQKARSMDAEGVYTRVSDKGEEPVGAQETFYQEALKAVQEHTLHQDSAVFQPMRAPHEVSFDGEG